MLPSLMIVDEARRLDGTGATSVWWMDRSAMSDLPVGWSVQEAGLPIVLRLSPAGLDAIYPLTSKTSRGRPRCDALLYAAPRLSR